MKQQKGVAMYCPVCSRGKIIIAASYQQAQNIHLHPPSDADSAVCFTKCRLCGNQIGVSFQEAQKYQEPIQIPLLKINCMC